MNIFKLSIKNIQSKPMYTFLAVFVLALSIALLLGISQLKSSFTHQMDNNLGDIDMVIGAKGSPLQLVLASVLHLDNPTGNISYGEAKKIRANPLIKRAIPISYGDNYKGYRIVGTTPEFIDVYRGSLLEGNTVVNPEEVVLGAEVASQLNLEIGSSFLSSHGLIDNDLDVHDQKLKVVGILRPTEKVIDRLIITSLETIWNAHDHDDHKDEDHEEHTEDQREITSLLVTFRSPTAVLMLPRQINDNTLMQAALPKYELDRLLEFTGVGIKTISLIAYLILAIAALTIFLSLFKMVKERAFDLALLRTYGASNFQLVKMVVYEGFIIGLGASLLGFLFVKFWLYFMFKFGSLGYRQNFLQDMRIEDVWHLGILVVLVIVLAIAMAIYPLIKMNISTILSNEK